MCITLIINANLKAQEEYDADEMTKITDDIAILRAKVDQMEEKVNKSTTKPARIK